jgi:Trk K+ transport system NAD-binding subunit
VRPTILLAGLGETGSELTRKLVQNWDVVAVDRDRAALEACAARVAADAPLRTHAGDATSALVLRRCECGKAFAAVACTGSDETNLEVLRLAAEELGIETRVALMYSLDWEERYQRAGHDVVSQDHACAALLEAVVQRGQKVATTVGLGAGEIIEVQVLHGSSMIGRTLSELGPRRWLVGAVYRDGELIVPHGDTTIEQGDRVLIIGDPEILPSIASLIRSGESEFPLQHGSAVVTLGRSGSAALAAECAYLVENTRADRIVAVSEQPAVADELAEAQRLDAGVLVLPPEPLGFLARIGLGRSSTARVLEQASVPALVARGTTPYRRVMLALAELPFPAAAAQLAVDLARIFGAELQLLVVHAPDIVEGTERRAELDRRRRELERLAGMYHLDVETITREGNPIHATVAASDDCELLVLPYRKRHKGSLTRPDVTLNLIHRARCSVIAMPA